MISIDNDASATKITLPGKKRTELVEAIGAVIGCGRGMATVAHIRTLAGRGSWIGGLLPQVRPFVRMLWGASARPGCASGKGFIFIKQVRQAFLWLKALAEGSMGCFVRTVIVADATAGGVAIAVAGSP